ncbi:hypothetical protein B0F90DRAFT_1758645 [Multifurca ochricompacta]|uniref:WD40 repeat-like protein n=1 Tax=Multifurca ochricompacta TaxID=376703 RepID=A0AAD4LZL2_9AGAM|nr:hypothetical protein B0F90DRAFT_1758645 [Multifurca ochricompacta]
MAPLPPRRRVSYVIPFPPSTNPHGSVNPILLPSSLPEGILYTGGRDGLVIAWDLNIPMKRRTFKTDSPHRSSSHWELITGWSDDVIDETLDEDKDQRSDGDILGDVKGSAKRRRPSSATVSSGSTPFEHQWVPDADALRPGRPSTFRQAVQIHSDWVNDILLCNQNQTLVSASSDGTVKAWNPHSSPSSDPVTVGTHADYVRCLAYSREQGWVASGSFDRTIRLWDLSRASQVQTAPPITTLAPPESSGAKASIYALAVDPCGQMIVSGGPERVIRMWDPRAGKRIGKLVGHTDNIRAILVSEDSRSVSSIKLWSLTSQRCLHTFTHHTDSVWALYSSHPSLEIFYSGDKSGFVAKVDVEGCADMSEGECVLVCQDVASPADGVTKLVALDDTLVWTASGSSSLRRWRAPPRRSIRSATLLDPPPSAASRTSSRLRPSRSTDSRPRSITLDPPSSPPLQRLPRHSSSMSAASTPALEPPLHLLPDDGTGEGETTWYGLPYDCLVHLASPLSDPFTPFMPVYRGRGTGADADIATLYSAASLMSVSARPFMLRTPLSGAFPSPPSPTQSPASIGRPVSPAQSDISPSGGGLGTGALGSPSVGGTGGGLGRHRTAFESREVVADAQPFSSTPDFVLVGAPGLVRAVLLSNRVHALTVDTTGTVAVWDIVRFVCVGQYTREDVLAASSKSRDGSLDQDEEGYVFSPREALDIVRERIDGEAVVVSWSAVDTSTGVLNVHLDEHAFDAELYGDELGCPPDRALPASVVPEDVRINLGKWVLRNLFLGFIHEEQQAHDWRLRTAGVVPLRTIPAAPSSSPPRGPSGNVDGAGTTIATGTSSVVVSQTMLSVISPNHLVGLGIAHVPLLLPLSQTRSLPSQTVGSPVTPGDNELLSTPQPQTHSQPQPVSNTAHHRAQTEIPTPSTTLATQKGQDYFTARPRRPSVSSGGGSGVPAPTTPDDVSGWNNLGLGSAAGAAVGSSAGGSAASGNGLAMPSTPGGGLMGKLRGLGRTTKRAQSESAPGTPVPMARSPVFATTGTGTPLYASAAPATTPSSIPVAQEPPMKPPTTAQVVLAGGTLNPPSAAEGPTLPITQDIPLLIAEERAPGWAIVYRGTVASAGTTEDVAKLEDAMPVWLLEYLLLGRAPQVSVVKVGFILLPMQSGVPGEEVLPDLVNTLSCSLVVPKTPIWYKLTFPPSLVQRPDKTICESVPSCAKVGRSCEF